MLRLFAPALLMMSITMTAHAEDPASADTFEREVAKVLKAAHASKKSVYLHVAGQTIGGAVTAIGPDSVIIRNREHETIIVRRERIDAVEAD